MTDKECFYIGWIVGHLGATPERVTRPEIKLVREMLEAAAKGANATEVDKIMTAIETNRNEQNAAAQAEAQTAPQTNVR
jgi:hypothetical protein